MSIAAPALAPRAAIPSRSRAVAAAVGAARFGYRVLNGAWTGAVVSFVVAALVAGTITGSGLYLGAGRAFDMLVGGLADLVLLGVLWLLVRGLRRLLGALTARLSPALTRRAAGHRVAALVARALAALDRWLRHPRRSSGLALAAIGFTLIVSSGPPVSIIAPSPAYLPAILLLTLVGALAGAAREIAPRRLDAARPRARLVVAVATGGLAVVLLATGAAWVAWPGPGTVAATPPIPVAAAPIDLADPGRAGPFAVRTTAYGAGIDPRRPEFGADTPIRTTTVDVSRANPDLAFPGGEYTRWFIGGGMEALPLNALVWYPDGPGPFPLTLIVHGNHAMGDYSEPGYAYLGEHLASRGFIVASVDEASLNGDMFGDFLGNEMPVRALVLLKHLELWRAWNADPASPFHGLVDMERVALMGHSRGGEAAAVAAYLAHADPGQFSTLTAIPTGLDVDAVVGIAPPDGQWEGTGHAPLRLDGVDYLTLQGGLDADMAWWASLRQLARASVAGDADAFKAAAWIRRANHGRFSTVWGLGDLGNQGEYLLDQASILSPDEQQDVAKTLIAGFLEASLMGRDGYRSLFAVPAAGRDWLPADTYVTRLVEGSTAMLFDPDGTGSLKLQPDAATRVMLATPPTRASNVLQENLVAAINWSGPDGASVAIDLPAAGGPLAGRTPTADGSLRFAIASSSLDPAVRLPEVSVELEDRAGTIAVVSLAAFGGLFPPVPTPPMKSAAVSAPFGIGPNLASDAEVHLQTFALPVSAFTAANPDFDPATIATIRFRLAGPPTGAVFLDEVGIDPGR